MKLKWRWREQYKNRVIQSVIWEDTRNVIVPRRMSLIEFCSETTLNSFFHILFFNLGWEKEHVGIVSGRATGSNFVNQPCQCQSLLNR